MSQRPPTSPEFSRRQVLTAGGLGLLGLGLPELLAARAQAAATPMGAKHGPGFGRAKRCILLFMWGGPSHLDTFDLKPHAPAEVRGEFKPIATKAGGVEICEHFQKLALQTDKLAIIRSLNHDDSAHLSSGHLALTGSLAPAINSDADPPSERDTPHMGSVIAKLQADKWKPAASAREFADAPSLTRRASRRDDAALPPFVSMPWLCYHPAAPGGHAPGQHGGWLGRRYDPLLLQGDLNAANWKVPELTLEAGVSLDRLESRRALLRLVDQQRVAWAAGGAAETVGSYQEQAFGLLSSAAARQAFDLSQEPPEVRERYGRNLHGQCVLLARRLVEHGVPLVSVNWHNDGKNFWDTHGNNFARLKGDLIPPADRALAALLEDLEQRGLLAETIVAWVGEFGRKPQISANNAGREHWPHCYSGLLAGGGIAGGQVYGSSDVHAAHPAHLPVSPQDYTATLFHALGIDPRATLADRQGRPHFICAGQPLTSLWS